ncbi:hypothetical protein TIFTF001_002127 [Ficus carica]|uniref:Auxin efflux carrier family protein n=1 Tax=Ficus carica TaxID=3494 RepID=A0AA87Z394_FICCA|nr:hypothetical protein TIFTF001_002127 [Ficus carica]
MGGVGDLFVVASIPVLKLLMLTALGSILAYSRSDILADHARNHLNSLVFFVFNPAFVISNLAKSVTLERIISLPFGAPHVCHSSGMTYASLSMAIGAIFLWSYVYNIVRISSSTIDADDMKSCLVLPKRTSDLVEGRFSNSEALVLAKCRGENKVPISKKIKHYLMMFSSKINLKALFTPSVIGAVIGFIIGIVPQIRKLIIDDGAPLLVFQDSASLVSDAAVPTVTLIMGANLLKGLKRSGDLVRVIVGIIGVRYVMQPVIGVAIVKAAKHFGAVHSQPRDPLYEFVLLLQHALPPAMNIGTITQLFGTGQSECSLIMLWTYAFASLSLTLWSTFFMWLVA